MFSYNLNFFSLTTIVLQYNLQELIGISTLTILPLHQDETRLKISQLSRTVSIQNVHHPKQPDSNPIEIHLPNSSFESIERHFSQTA